MIYTSNAIRSHLFKFQLLLRKALLKKKRVRRASAFRDRKKAEIPRDKHPNYWDSAWGQLIRRLSSIVGGPPIDSRDAKLFRRRFRVPWLVYVALVEMCIEKSIFGVNAHKECDVANRKLCPIEIKLLAVLRILGRNWSFDDIAEATLMGESTARRAFHTFCENFVREYYTVYVHRPEGEKLQRVMDVYARMGLPGCVGSTDCVHLKWDRCPISIANLCSGKEGYPSLAYSCVVDHHRRILGSTASFFGARNDKTIVRHDRYITDVKYKLVNDDISFNVFIDGVLTPQRGVYYICDGGYHKWTCMMNPLKHTGTRDRRLWSEWVESTRKDVECCFGILKARWRFLRNGIVLQKQEFIDNVFFTCCILHNLILEFDGLDSRWENDVDWDTMNPQPDNSDEGYDEEEVSVQQQLINSRVEEWVSARVNTPEVDDLLDNDYTVEVDRDFDSKRDMLIAHFIFAYNAGLVKWPKHLKPELRACYNKGS